MTTQKLLSRFLSTMDSDSRDYVLSPVREGNFIYATNGWIMVRIPYVDGIDCLDGAAVNFGRFFEGSPFVNELPIPPLPTAEKCPICNGSCIAFKCQDCDGEGEFQHGRHSYSCQECDGSGDVDDGAEEDKKTCWHCSGYGVEPYQFVDLGPQRFARRLLAQIIELPGSRFFQPSEDEDGSAYFTFDGGEGVVMPMRK